MHRHLHSYSLTRKKYTFPLTVFWDSGILIALSHGKSEPGLRKRPVAHHRSRRNTKCLPSFFDAQDAQQRHAASAISGRRHRRLSTVSELRRLGLQLASDEPNAAT